MSIAGAAATAGILAGILLELAREGALALNRIPVTSAGTPEQSAKDLAALVRELVTEKVLDADQLSRRIEGVEYLGEFGPELCDVCSGILDFGQRGDGPGEQDPETGRCTCSNKCRDAQ